MICCIIMTTFFSVIVTWNKILIGSNCHGTFLEQFATSTLEFPNVFRWKSFKNLLLSYKFSRVWNFTVLKCKMSKAKYLQCKYRASFLVGPSKCIHLLQVAVVWAVYFPGHLGPPTKRGTHWDISQTLRPIHCNCASGALMIFFKFGAEKCIMRTVSTAT